MSYKKNTIIIRRKRKISVCEYYLGGGCNTNNNNNNNTNKIHPDLVKLHEDIDRTKDWNKTKNSSGKLPFIKEHDDNNHDDYLEIHSIWGDSYYDKFLKYSCFKSSRVKNIHD